MKRRSATNSPVASAVTITASIKANKRLISSTTNLATLSAIMTRTSHRISNSRRHPRNNRTRSSIRRRATRVSAAGSTRISSCCKPEVSYCKTKAWLSSISTQNRSATSPSRGSTARFAILSAACISSDRCFCHLVEVLLCRRHNVCAKEVDADLVPVRAEGKFLAVGARARLTRVV